MPVGSAVVFHEALGAVGLADRDGVYWAGRATLVPDPDGSGGYTGGLELLATQLPIVGDAVPGFVDLKGLVDTILSIDPTAYTTGDDYALALSGLTGVTATCTATGISLDIAASAPTQSLPIDFAVTSEAIDIASNATIDLDADLSLHIDFGYDGSKFFIDATTDDEERQALVTRLAAVLEQADARA